MQEKPYPVLDILLLQPPHVLVHIKWTIIRTFEEVLKVVSKTGISSNFLKFIIRMPDDILSEALQGELRAKFQQCLHDAQPSEELYLSLLSRKDKQLMLDIIEYLKETKWQYFRKPLGSKEFVLYHALKTNEHFINPLIKELSDFKAIEDITLRNNMIILKLIHEFSSKTTSTLDQLPNVELLVEFFDLENVEEDLLPIYSYFYKDFKRLSTIQHYIGTFPQMSATITVEEVLNMNSLVEIISKHKLLSSYEEAKNLLETYYAWQQNVPLLSLKEREYEIICCYYILSMVYDIITATAVEPDGFYKQKLHSLNSFLRQISFEMLCQILEDIINFVYLRWEHFNKDSRNAKHHRLLESTDSSQTDDDILQDSSTKSSNAAKINDTKSTNKHVKTGFVCKSKPFANIFNFLKTFVTKKLHSADFKNSSSDLKLRFQNIVDCITDLLWKYGFFEKMEMSQNQDLSHKSNNVHFDPDTLIYFVHFHTESLERISSDDEDQTLMNHYSFSRRKAVKKRRRATFSGSVVTTASDREHALQRSRDRSTILSANSFMLSKISEEKSVVPKLLSSPERLAILALSFKQFNDAKKIIEVSAFFLIVFCI